MRFVLAAATLAFTAGMTLAQDLSVTNGYVPVAPPSAMAHAAYFELTNESDVSRSLIGVSAEGYAMAHIHQSSEQDGIATMAMLHQLDIAPGQSVAFKPGGLHVMLMRPTASRALGEMVELELQFSDGQTLAVVMPITARKFGTDGGS